MRADGVQVPWPPFAMSLSNGAAFGHATCYACTAQAAVLHVVRGGTCS